MADKLSRETLKNILQAEDIEKLTLSEIYHYFLNEQEIEDYIPDGICQIDPRNGDRVVYNTARALRPHDNLPGNFNLISASPEKDCVICQGRTTGVLDVADLSEGFTFINKNLFPILFPTGTGSHFLDHVGDDTCSPAGMPAHGLHFLQWTSSLHDRDWHNMPQLDRQIVLRRLAALEKRLISSSENLKFEPDRNGSRNNWPGFVSVIKNYGRLVGGSLEHGHQQIAFGNVMPRRFNDNFVFETHRGETFSSYLMRVNPADLLIRDYGRAILLTPYFMRRPFDLVLLVKDVNKSYLYELNDGEIASVANGWQDAIRAMLTVMPLISRETAYNVITHTGPGCGVYFEFLPYTQETGGFEHLGLFLCQGNPQMSAGKIRSILSEISDNDLKF